VTTIRPETAADEAAVHDLTAAAFGDETVARLVDLVRASPYFAPGLSLVAEADGRILGHVMLSRAPLRREEATGAPDVEVLLLSPLSVHPDAQRRGIGSALVRHALTLAEERGEPLVMLEGDPKLYGRFGFEPAGRHGIERPSERIPEWAFQVRRLAGYDPALRGRLEYPSAFWETGSVGP
jgi:putative acetyltransferase